MADPFRRFAQNINTNEKSKSEHLRAVSAIQSFRKGFDIYEEDFNSIKNRVYRNGNNNPDYNLSAFNIVLEPPLTQEEFETIKNIYIREEINEDYIQPEEKPGIIGSGQDQMSD